MLNLFLFLHMVLAVNNVHDDELQVQSEPIVIFLYIFYMKVQKYTVVLYPETPIDYLQSMV
jgi:hypothetical protein